MAKRSKWDGSRRPYRACACDKTAWFELSGGPFVAIIDKHSVDLIGHWNWRVEISGRSLHVRRMAGGECIYLHQSIIGDISSPEIDHRDGNGLDNRRSNLRGATVAQNRANTRRIRSGKSAPYKGVSFNKAERKFKAYIGRRHLGTFESAQDAARAYDREAIVAFGEFAATNASIGLI